MNKPLMTPEEVFVVVESDGLDYALENSLHEDEIEPGPLRDAWRDARLATKRIRELLDVYWEG